ncbi:hypothetical protein BO443_10120 [Burkholderia orbicola]
MRDRAAGMCRSSIVIASQRVPFSLIRVHVEPAAPDAYGLSRLSIYVMISILIFMLTGRCALPARRPLF